MTDPVLPWALAFLALTAWLEWKSYQHEQEPQEAIMEFTDRYQALGMAEPDPATMCKGPCEGCGVYPLFDARGLVGRRKAKYLAGQVTPSEQLSDAERLAWADQHFCEGEHACDGWHFIKCPDCHGTGKLEGKAGS